VPPAVDPSIYSDKNARFELRPDFRRVLTALPTFKADQTLFAWEEVVELLKQYILSNQSFFDRRNILVALVKDDPLGQAFQPLQHPLREATCKASVHAQTTNSPPSS
jgi:hypothetical protein